MTMTMTMMMTTLIHLLHGELSNLPPNGLEITNEILNIPLWELSFDVPIRVEFRLSKLIFGLLKNLIAIVVVLGMLMIYILLTALACPLTCDFLIIVFVALIAVM